MADKCPDLPLWPPVKYRSATLPESFTVFMSKARSFQGQRGGGGSFIFAVVVYHFVTSSQGVTSCPHHLLGQRKKVHLLRRGVRTAAGVGDIGDTPRHTSDIHHIFYCLRLLITVINKETRKKKLLYQSIYKQALQYSVVQTHHHFLIYTILFPWGKRIKIRINARECNHEHVGTLSQLLTFTGQINQE